MFCFSPVPALPPPPADQERAELAAGRRHLEARQALYAELQTQLDNCPESVREQLQEQLRRVSFTSSPSLAPEGHPPRRQESGGTGPPGPCTSCRTPGSVLWLGRDREGLGREGAGTDFHLSATAGSDARERGKKPNRGKGVGLGAGPFPNFPGAGPQNSCLCGLAPQARGGLGSIIQPPLSLSFKEAEALETETKLFEDLEFQQLERESRVEEERELAGQGLLRSKAELLHSITKRKVCPAPVPCGASVPGGGEASDWIPTALGFPSGDAKRVNFTFTSGSLTAKQEQAVRRIKRDGKCGDHMCSDRSKHGAGSSCW